MITSSWVLGDRQDGSVECFNGGVARERISVKKNNGKMFVRVGDQGMKIRAGENRDKYFEETKRGKWD